MRRSRVLEKIRGGGVAGCVKLNLSDPRVVELAGQAGFDSVWLDMEHIATDWHTIEHCVRAAKITDTDVIVRVAKGSYSDYIRPLEADATGIMIPHLMSRSEAEEIVRRTKFHPVGLRPLDGGNQDGAYTQIPLTDYLEQANRERYVCAQIEDPEALDDLDNIAAVPGLDMLLFGPGDYAQALGIPGQMDDPRIDAARRKVADACRTHGKIAATVGSPGAVARYAEMGYQYINVGADVLGLITYFGEISSIFDR